MEIDQLSIGIETTAKDTISTIDELNKKLGVLATSLGKINGSAITGLANGVNRLETAMQGMKSVDNQAFDDLATNIRKLGNVKTADLNNTSSAMSILGKAVNNFSAASEKTAQIGDLAKNLSRLGYKSMDKAITNIPLLATAMKDLMQTLSTAPRVSQNLIDMTNALANFTQQGSKVSVVSGELVSGLNRSSKAMNNAKKNSLSLAAAFGKFYATYFLLIRSAKKLWGSIESSFDYLEVLNYFDAAFGQVAANADMSQFEKMGYNSAEAYYGSFAKRAEELTQKMSGFTVGENGLLQSAGAVSLGLDPSQLMNYQAMFGQMSSSMGVSSETALKLSQALTEIGADLASVKNLDFESVWNDMASGLAGMSRTLDKYGVNIRNVNLQQKLMELGIDANIQALNQNDKALLRAIILLENTKYAWGDLADTINQPANQLRLIEANFQNLSRTIGNLFLPLVKTVLPYVNALVIAVQRLFAWLGNLIGIDISDISTSIGGADMGDILDQTDELESGLGGAKKAADKLNKSLRQFDELKVINTKQDDGGTGGGAGIQGGLLDEAFNDAFTKYQQEWDKAFGELENRAQEIADKIEKAFEPIKKIIKDFAIGDFFQAGKDVSALVVSITDFFADAIDKVDWYGIGQKIGDFFAGLDWPAIFKAAGNLIWQGLKAAFELYVGAFSSAPLETALVSLVAFPKLLKAITASKFITGIGKLWKNFKVWGEKISLVTGALSGNEAAASGLYMLYPKLSKKVDGVKTAFSKFFTSVKTNGFWKTVDGGITNIRNNLGGLQKAAIVAVAGFAEFSVVSDSVEKLTLGTENWLAEIGKIGGVAAVAAGAMYTALGTAGLAITAIVGVVGAIKGINDAFDTIRAQEIGESIKNAMSNPGGVPLSEVTAQFSDAIGKIGESFSVVTEKAAGLEQADNHIRDTWMEIEKIETAMESGVMSVEEGTAELTRLFGELATTASEKFTALENTLLVAFGENGVLNEVFERLGISTDNTTSTIIQLNDKVEKRIEELTKLLAETDPSNPYYATYKEELAGLMAQTDELTQAISNYDAALENIDLGDLFDEKTGEIQIEKLEGFLSELSAATETANTDIKNAVKSVRTSLEQEKSLAESLGDWAAAEELEEKIGGLDRALELLQEDVSLKAAELTDPVQTKLIGGLDKVIEDAKIDWEEKGGFGRWINGVFGGADTEAAYVQEAVNKQVENIDKVSTAINEQLGNLQTDGVVWASDAVREIYKALFNFGDNEAVNRGLNGLAALTLNEDFKSLINGATEGISELAKERGKDATDGYASGFSDEANIQNAQNEAKSFTEKVIETIAKTQDSNSPSKVTMALGKDATDGYAKGFRDEENIENAQNAAFEFTSSVLDKFSEVIAPMNQIGIDAMQGLLNGLSSMESSIYAKADEIANNVANAVKKALDIHSPSRVMFRLGDFTMQGFKEGMENLYNPIADSIKAFSYDVAVAPAPLTDIYSGYHYYTSEYMQSGYTGNDSSIFGMSETAIYNLFYNAVSTAINNSKLMNDQKDMVEGILKKPTTEIGDLNTALARDSMYRGGNIRGGSMSRLAVAEELYY